MQTLSEKFRKKITMLLLYAALAIVGLTGLLIYLHNRRLDTNRAQMLQHYELLKATQQMLANLREAEAAQRAFLLTGEAAYQEAFEQMKSTIPATLAQLRQLGAENTAQQQRIAQLDQLLGKQLDALAQIATPTDSAGMVQSREQLNQSRTGSEQIRQRIEEIDREENMVLEALRRQTSSAGAGSAVLEILAGLFVIAIIGITIRTIRRERRARQQIFADLDKHNRELLLDRGNATDAVEEAIVIRDLISNLEDATQFIRKIGEGNYQVELAGIGEHNRALNQHNLSGELIDMRDQMKRIEQEAGQRNWATAGLAQFGEILRSNSDNLQELSYTIISNLVKYLHANQGGIFLVNDDHGGEVHLELAACYAYNRKKYLTGKIAPGEGLLGQAYLERDIIYLTEVPDNYVRITSGLGEANPRCILIAPLQVNEQIFGVMELASFVPLEAYQIEFVKKLSESIAATLSTVRTNQKTKALLEETQLMAEMMRAQEEEMRQNMEELAATQEEIQRARDRVEEERALMNATMNSSLDMVMVTNREGELLYYNDTVKNMYRNLGVEVQKGFNIYSINSPEERAKWQQYTNRVYAGESFAVEESAQMNGETIYFEARYYPARHANGSIVGVAISSRDITARRAQEMALQEANEMMRAQEEVLRQHLEELAAAQEEMRRREQEYQQKIQDAAGK